MHDEQWGFNSLLFAFSSLSLWFALMKLEQRAAPQTPKESGDE